MAPVLNVRCRGELIFNPWAKAAVVTMLVVFFVVTLPVWLPCHMILRWFNRQGFVLFRADGSIAIVLGPSGFRPYQPSSVEDTATVILPPSESVWPPE